MRGFANLRTHLNVASSWEVLPELVEGRGHNAVRGVKRFFNTIAVVNVDINIQNALMGPFGASISAIRVY